jgi:hypothetical protein
MRQKLLALAQLKGVHDQSENVQESMLHGVVSSSVCNTANARSDADRDCVRQFLVQFHVEPARPQTTPALSRADFMVTLAHC